MPGPVGVAGSSGPSGPPVSLNCPDHLLCASSSYHLRVALDLLGHKVTKEMRESLDRAESQESMVILEHRVAKATRGHQEYLDQSECLVRPDLMDLLDQRVLKAHLDILYVNHVFL